MTEQTVLVVTQRMFKFDLKISAFGVIVVTCRYRCRPAKVIATKTQADMSKSSED